MKKYKAIKIKKKQKDGFYGNKCGFHFVADIWNMMKLVLFVLMDFGDLV
jgi:hypothetical protein